MSINGSISCQQPLFLQEESLETLQLIFEFVDLMFLLKEREKVSGKVSLLNMRQRHLQVTHETSVCFKCKKTSVRRFTKTCRRETKKQNINISVSVVQKKKHSVSVSTHTVDTYI